MSNLADDYPTNKPIPNALNLSVGADLITAERVRQIDEEGWTPEHDAEHDMGELIRAARCYVEAAWTALVRDDAATYHLFAGSAWPWEEAAWKPSNDPVRNLVKAGALIAAEIDRLTADTGGDLNA